MSTPSKRAVAVAAILVLVFGLAVTWQLADVRATQAERSQAQQLVDGTVADRVSPGDYDGDGVPDATDACPTRPETTNGFQEGDGCPDVVATTGAS